MTPFGPFVAYPEVSRFAYNVPPNTRLAMSNINMNIRITKLYQGSEWGALEVAFNSAPEGDRMIGEIAEATGLNFKRPPANLLALRELHIAEVGDEQALEEAFVKAEEVASR